jgi:hypothetical protein
LTSLDKRLGLESVLYIKNTINFSEAKNRPPANYICHVCAMPGHYIFDCPVVGDEKTHSFIQKGLLIEKIYSVFISSTKGRPTRATKSALDSLSARSASADGLLPIPRETRHSAVESVTNMCTLADRFFKEYF